MTFLTHHVQGVILQVRGRDGMSTPQNGVAAYSHASRTQAFARVVTCCLPWMVELGTG